MSCLHTISQSPQTNLLDSCLAALNKDDAILFIEDGVYYCPRQSLLEKIAKETACFALKEDLNARGIELANETRIEKVSYRKFVELCTEYDKVINWF